MFGLVASSYSLWTKSTWRDLHFLVILLLMYCVTRKVLTVLHDTLSGIRARCDCGAAPFPHPFDTDMIRNAGRDASIFACRSQDFIVKLLHSA